MPYVSYCKPLALIQNNMGNIIIEVTTQQKDSLHDLLKESESDFEIIASRNFDGSDIVSFLIGISSISIPLITKFLIEQIKSKKHITVKHKGTVIKGLSEKNTMKVLKKILNEKQPE